MWLNVVLATHNGFRRQGFARRLKLAVMQEAPASRVIAITSVVSWKNVAMRRLNRELGGTDVEIITDVEPDPENCRCILPISLKSSACPRLSARYPKMSLIHANQ